ncbi:MAG TPA: recombinase family protein [Polyangiaceae bacterium]
MRVAIYARRSKEEHQAESIDTQLENSRRFIIERGWRSAGERVFIDSDHSRAEFKNRPGLNALLAAANAGEIDTIVLRDETRLGGDTLYAGLTMQTLIDAGCRVFFYSTGEELRFNDATSKIMLTLRNFHSELERERIASRTRENLERKARAGMNAGGRCFGYDNVRPNGDARGFVNYRINETEARVVREIFERYASGEGLKAIAKELNARGVSSPRAGARGKGRWMPSAIHAMLRNERYRGTLIWGRCGKTYRGGTRVRVTRSQAQCVRAERPDLRIIADDLWKAAHARFSTKVRMGRQSPRGTAPKYLLSGLSRCGVCGGRMQVTNSKAGRETIKVYSCAHHRELGTCDNSLRRPVSAVDGVVLDWISEHVLNEELVLKCLREVRRRLSERSSKTASDIPELEKRARQLAAEIERLGEAVLTSTEAPRRLVQMMSDREKELDALQARINALKTAPSVFDLEVRRLEKEARARLSDLRGLMRRNTEQARQAIESLLTGPLVFTPTETADGKRYRIQAEASIERAAVGDVARFSIEGDPNGN